MNPLENGENEGQERAGGGEDEGIVTWIWHKICLSIEYCPRPQNKERVKSMRQRMRSCLFVMFQMGFEE